MKLFEAPQTETLFPISFSLILFHHSLLVHLQQKEKERKKKIAQIVKSYFRNMIPKKKSNTRERNELCVQIMSMFNVNT